MSCDQNANKFGGEEVLVDDAISCGNLHRLPDDGVVNCIE